MLLKTCLKNAVGSESMHKAVELHQGQFCQDHLTYRVFLPMIILQIICLEATCNTGSNCCKITVQAPHTLLLRIVEEEWQYLAAGQCW